MRKFRKYKLHDGKLGAAITVQIEDSARNNKISTISSDGTIGIKLNVPADDPQVNQVLIEYLAEILSIATPSIEIIGGHSGREKLIAILGLDSESVQERILKCLS